MAEDAYMIFFVLSQLSFMFRTLCNKEYTRHFSSPASNILFNVIGLGVTFLISLIFKGAALPPSPAYLLLCLLFGTIFAVVVMLMLVCYSKGPLGQVNLVFQMCTLVPVVFGILVFHEAFNWQKGIGIALMLVVFVLSFLNSKAGDPSSDRVFVPARVWMPVTVLTMLLNGCLSTIQNSAVQLFPETKILTFNFWSFLFGTLILIVIYVIYRLGHEADPLIKQQPAKFYTLALVCGMLSSGGNIFIMYALKTIPSTVAYPLLACINTVALHIIGLVFYKDARTRYGLAMILIGLVSIVLLNIA